MERLLRPLLRFPLRWTVPLLLLSSAGLFAGYDVVKYVPALDRQVEQQAIADARQMLSVTQRSLDQLARKGDWEGVRAQVAGMAAGPSVLAALLVDDSGEILAATRSHWMGKIVAAVAPQLDTTPVVEVSRLRVGQVHLAEDGRSLTGYYPVELGTAEGALRPTRIGALLLHADLTRRKAAARDRLILQIVEPVALVVGLAIAVWLLFHYMVTRRVQRLVTVTERFASGDMSARSRLDGADEVALLARAFDQMADTVQQDRQQLAHNEQRTRAVLDNVVDGIVTMTEGNFISSINPAAEQLFGYQLSELAGRHVSVLVEPSQHRQFNQALVHAADTTATRSGMLEFLGRRREGTSFDMEFAISDIPGGSELRSVAIVRDITERKEMDRMKTEFVSVVSHELRTPLTSLRGSLGLLAGGAAGELPAKIRQLVDLADRNSTHLANLVNDILDYEKLRFGYMKMEVAPHSLIEVAEEAIADNGAYAAQLGIRLVLDANEAEIIAEVDVNRLKQVLNNLISNAAKFSPPGETVIIRIASAANNVRVEVQDCGGGIPESFRSRLFEAFSQLDSSDTREKGGTGLGLSICKAIIEQLGGHIDYESQMGKGTTFFFDLPTVAKSEQVA